MVAHRYQDDSRPGSLQVRVPSSRDRLGPPPRPTASALRRCGEDLIATRRADAGAAASDDSAQVSMSDYEGRATASDRRSRRCGRASASRISRSSSKTDDSNTRREWHRVRMVRSRPSRIR
jgi:hypothetical protein